MDRYEVLNEWKRQRLVRARRAYVKNQMDWRSRPLTWTGDPPQLDKARGPPDFLCVGRAEIHRRRVRPADYDADPLVRRRHVAAADKRREPDRGAVVAARRRRDAGGRNLAQQQRVARIERQQPLRRSRLSL